MKPAAHRPVILLAEDSPGLARLMMVTLQLRGYHPELEVDGDRVVNAARMCKPAAILLDLFLPQLDGLSVLALLKADENLKHIPVLICTAHDAPGMAEKAKEAGAASYVIKPFDMPAVMNQLDELTNRVALATAYAASKVAQSRPSFEQPRPSAEASEPRSQPVMAHSQILPQPGREQDEPHSRPVMLQSQIIAQPPQDAPSEPLSRPVSMHSQVVPRGTQALPRSASPMPSSDDKPASLTKRHSKPGSAIEARPRPASSGVRPTRPSSGSVKPPSNSVKPGSGREKPGSAELRSGSGGARPSDPGALSKNETKPDLDKSGSDGYEADSLPLPQDGPTPSSLPQPVKPKTGSHVVLDAISAAYRHISTRIRRRLDSGEKPRPTAPGSRALQRMTVSQNANTKSSQRPQPMEQAPRAGELFHGVMLSGKTESYTTYQVWRGFHQASGNEVLLYILTLSAGHRDALKIHAEQLTRLKALDHPLIVRLLDFNLNGTWPYLMTKPADGLPLEVVIGQFEQLRPDLATRVASSAAEALEAVAQLGIHHGRLTSRSLLVARGGQTMLADLALALVLPAPGQVQGDTAMVPYLAPERIQGAATSGSDIYALGGIMYHMLAGQPPHDDDDLASDDEAEIVHVATHRPDLETTLSDLVMRMLDPEPEQRPHDWPHLRHEFKLVRTALRLSGTNIVMHKSSSGRLGVTDASTTSLWNRLYSSILGRRPKQ